MTTDPVRIVPDEIEQTQFWDSLKGVTPTSYAKTTADDGDTLAEEYAPEDADLSAEKA